MRDLSEVAVVVLAAGFSRRYGSGDKLLADLDGRALASHCADMLSLIGFGHAIAVCKDEPDLVTLFAERGFTILVNEGSARGQASSLALGVEAAAKVGAASVLIYLADMPRVGVPHLEALLNALEQSPNGIAASANGSEGSSSPPVVFHARHFPELMSLSGDQGARHLLRHASIVVAPPGELVDFDTPADFT